MARLLLAGAKVLQACIEADQEKRLRKLERQFAERFGSHSKR